jgi:hypothetical protein
MWVAGKHGAGRLSKPVAQQAAHRAAHLTAPIHPEIAVIPRHKRVCGPLISPTSPRHLEVVM